MEYGKMLRGIIDELANNAEKVSTDRLEALADAILGAKRIFVAGAGRAGFAARAFALRLMHLGLTVFFVGEPTTPSIGPGDLLVINSGSGETGSLVVMARRAKGFGAKLATATIYPQATVGSLADVVVPIPGATPKSELADTVKSIQPMGNAFEQMSWLCFDVVIMILMDRMHKDADEMFRLHANLE
jgi:6-phospho-3-hexuloisomerase